MCKRRLLRGVSYFYVEYVSFFQSVRHCDRPFPLLGLEQTLRDRSERRYARHMSPTCSGVKRWEVAIEAGEGCSKLRIGKINASFLRNGEMVDLDP